MGYRSPADPIFDPFWARCAEAEILVCIHLGESGYYRQSGDYTGRYRRHAFSLSPFEHVYLHGRAITDFLSAMVLQGAFTRHPRLRLLSVENGSDWFPFFVESCKLYYQRYPADFPEDPMAAIQRNLWISPYWEDPLPELAATLSTSKLLAGSDFPHAEGRQKWRNLCADTRVALSATDPADDGRYLEVRGRVVAWESDADLGFLDAQCLKYSGVDEFPREDIPPDQVRVIAVVEPLRCTTMG
jgi:predicted TIM-barrel fold metal-dependent hydrolase